MNWKQITLTAFITLIITIISGVIVNWYTKSNIEDKAKVEDLVYDIKGISKFESDSLKLSMFTVDILNVGGKKANEISVYIEFNEYSKIIDENAKLIRSNTLVKPMEVNNNKLYYKIDCLYPNDRISVNVVLNDLISNPKITLQSSDLIGKPIEIGPKTENSERSLEKGILTILLAVLMMFPMIYLLPKILKRLKGYSASLNNNAFLFIHNNQVQFAIDLLNKEITSRGGSSHELANLALAKCLIGDKKEEYEALLRMSEFISGSQQGNLVIQFNRFLIAGKNKNYLKAKENYENAVKIGKKEFKKYLDYSLIYSELVENDTDFKKLIDELDKKYFA